MSSCRNILMPFPSLFSVQWICTLLPLGVCCLLLLHLALIRFRDRRMRLPPGPLLNLPLFGNWLQVGNNLTPRNLANLARKYGDIFLLRMGRKNVVILSSPELAKEMLHTRGVEFGSRFSSVAFDIFTGNGQDMVFTEYGNHWRKMRRIMTVPFFTNKAVQQWSPIWEEEIDRMIYDLGSDREANKIGVVIRKRLKLMIYNNMYTMAFDRRFESTEDPVFQDLIKLNDERSRLVQSFDYNSGEFNPILSLFMKNFLKSCWKLKERREELFKNFIAERMKVLDAFGSEGTYTKCGIDYIINAVKLGEISEQNLLYAIENINAAGTDTTLWTLEWSIAELVNHPHIQQRLFDELIDVLGQSGSITQTIISKLPYLQAVVKESLRLHPIIPLVVPHMNLKKSKLGGYDIPARSKVLVNTWWMANNPDLWKDPDKFFPDRFLDEKIDTNGGNFKYIPFGSGRRSCPGIVMALPIIHLTIAKLVRTFDLLPDKMMGKIDLSEREGQFTLQMANHPLVVFKRRH